MATTLVSAFPQPAFDYAESVVTVEVTAAQTFLYGQFVKLTTGKLVASASADTTIFGFALAPAVNIVFGTLNTRIPVLRAKAGQRFWINATGNTLAQSFIGLQYGLLVTGNIC